MGCRSVEVKNKERKREKLLEEKENLRFLKQIKSHSLIYQFQLIIIFNNSSFNPDINLSLSLSLIVDENTKTHTQLTHIYHINHQQFSSSTTIIHVFILIS